jgi:hypothetical protein
MEESELPLLAEIDRSERIAVGYEVHDGKLHSTPVDWVVPGFLREGDGEHRLAHQIAFCRRHLRAGGKMIGAFDGEKLAGIGILTIARTLRTGAGRYSYDSGVMRKFR